MKVLLGLRRLNSGNAPPPPPIWVAPNRDGLFSHSQFVASALYSRLHVRGPRWRQGPTSGHHQLPVAGRQGLGREHEAKLQALQGFCLVGTHFTSTHVLLTQQVMWLRPTSSGPTDVTLHVPVSSTTIDGRVDGWTDG